MQGFVKSLYQAVATKIVPILRQYESDYVADGYAQTLEQAFEALRRDYADIGHNAKVAASAFVGSVDNTNRQRFYKAMNNAIGIDVSNIIQSEGLEDTLLASTRENVNLIRSIPEEFFKKIETIVYTNTMQGARATSMIKEIQKTYGVTTKRARVIARDQTSKLNAALTQKRQENLGIEEYVWRTAEDGRVRDTHRANNGKTFRWDSPPAATGHPGHDIQCRCVAQPIIKL